MKMADVNKECSKTFLSSKVKNIICHEGIIHNIVHTSLIHNYTIDWQHIESLISDFSPGENEEEVLLKNTRKLSSLFLDCEQLLHNQTCEYYRVTYTDLLEWIANKQVFFECLSLVLKTNVHYQHKKHCDKISKPNDAIKDNRDTLSDNVTGNDSVTIKDNRDTLSDNVTGNDNVVGKDNRDTLSDNVTGNDNVVGKDNSETLSDNVSGNDVSDVGKDDSDTLSDNAICNDNVTGNSYVVGKDDSDTLSDNVTNDSDIGKNDSDTCTLSDNAICNDNVTGNDKNEKDDNDDTDELLSLLLITSCLERSLGDVYLMKGKQCPSILKDLLNTEELRHILGPVVVNVLKVIIGSPQSLNIRNIAWHGFFSPGELPKRYIYFLLVLIPSIGQILKCKNINPEIIPHRLPIQLPQDTHTFSINSEQIHHCLNGETREENVFIPQCMKSYLKQALFYYERKRYGYSLCLLWPLLEHSLRCIFADVNNCQYRVLTAESTSLYTTFDEILSKTLTPDEENKLVKMIGEGCMDLLYDVLVYPEGPRLRDRLSHGETDLSNISQHWIDKTFHIFIYLIYEFQFKNKLGIPESIIDFKFKIKEYESQYHPIALLKKKVQCVTTLNCNILEWIKIDPTLNSWECQEGFDVFVNENTSYKELETEIKEFIKNQKSDVFNSEIWYCEVFKNNIDIINVMLSRKISTLYRFDEIIQNDTGNSSKKIIRESEVVNLLLRINLELETVMVQIKSICLSRQEKLYNKQLRSRQRDNTQKLLYCLPVIHLSIHFVCVFTVYHLYKVQSYTQHHFNPLQRCLKLTLKFSENLRTFTGSDKNKWQESMELCVKNIKSLCNFLTELHRS